MMYSCAPRDAAASRSTTRGKNIKRGGKTLAVDLHCHVHTPAADEIAGKSEKQTDPTARYGNQRTAEHQKKLREELDRKLTSVEQRLADMDKMGVDVQAISTSPLQYYYGVEPDLGRQIARKINERLAEIQGGHPDRFAALGTLPMQAPELAVTELDYCMKELGFRGIELGTNVGGVELADARYEPLFARAEELGAVIFLHPIGFTEPKRLTRHFLTNVIGNPLDTTVALAHIVFGGVLERHPGLKFVAAHGGGFLAHYPARMDHAYKVRPECHDHITRPPSYYMKKIYYDTMVFGEKQLEHLVNLWGADHVVIGTDYPYDMGYYKPVGFVNGAKSLSRAQKDAIIGGNAVKLLGIKRRRR
ncbi:MAG TPA: amidohydrolase family protein [Burkholderiales bacterium]|nr:amidohydrolase family protein [Burkholderiales bacterium]